MWEVKTFFVSLNSDSYVDSRLQKERRLQEIFRIKDITSNL